MAVSPVIGAGWLETPGCVYRRHMRRILLLVSIVLWALVPAIALAQVDIDAIASQLRADGYFAEPGADVGPGTPQALDDASIPIYLVVLAGDPGEDPSLTAQRIAELFGSGTFVVRTPDFIGVYSVDYDDGTVEQALGATLDRWRESNADGIKALDRELTGTGAFPFGLVLAGAVLLLVGWAVLRGRRAAQKAGERRTAERRVALGEQADDVANDILALSDRIQVADDHEATQHYRDANAIFSETQDAIAAASSEMEFVQLSTRLTEAEWHLEAAEALLEDRPVPGKPTDRPIECFFHQHKAGVEQAEIETPAGTRTVSVCRECADRLHRGESPAPRQVVVDGTRVPAGTAPRSYGGGGFGFDIFDVIVGSRRASYDWSRPRPRGGISLGGAGSPRSRSRSRSASRSTSRKSGGGRASRRL